jgi:hypothetical protein
MGKVRGRGGGSGVGEEVASGEAVSMQRGCFPLIEPIILQWWDWRNCPPCVGLALEGVWSLGWGELLP